MKRRIVLGHAFGSTGLPMEQLEKYIKWMKKLGYDFVSLDDLLNPKNTKKKCLSLVVDDAYKSVVEKLMPLLDQYEIRSTLFVPTGLIGLTKENPLLVQNGCYPNEDMMTIDDLENWMAAGHEVAFHTDKHINLSTLTKEDIEIDFENGISKLTEWGIKVDKFAYPFGFLPADKATFEILLRKHDINYAFTLWPGDATEKNIDKKHASIYINRICLGDKSPLWWNVMKSIGLLDFYLRKKSTIHQKP
jgi:peptidoglycan/xylan/chitin deacetylase (PgdA/CDA1 family)